MMSNKSRQQEMPADAEAVEYVPKNGDVYRCEWCGMELEIIADCGSEDMPHLECCGRPMSRAGLSVADVM